MVGEMVARNDLIVLNRGRDLTFRRGAEGSIIDLTIAAPRLASRIGNWCVLDVITLSDHQCIEFNIQERSHPVNTGRGGKVRSPSWNTKRLRKDKLREHLEETRLIDELGWARSAGSLEDTVRAARRKVVAECGHMLRHVLHVSPRAQAYRGLDVLVERPVVRPASKVPYSAAEFYPLKG